MKVCIGDRPQASDSHISVQEGSTSHGCSKNAEVGNTVSFIQVRNQIPTDPSTCQCQQTFQVAFGWRREGRSLCRTSSLHGVSDWEPTSYRCSVENMHWHWLSVKQGSPLYERGVASTNWFRTATLLETQRRDHNGRLTFVQEYKSCCMESYDPGCWTKYITISPGADPECCKGGVTIIIIKLFY